jgi:hypothetical protein
MVNVPGDCRDLATASFFKFYLQKYYHSSPEARGIFCCMLSRFGPDFMYFQERNLVEKTARRMGLSLLAVVSPTKTRRLNNLLILADLKKKPQGIPIPLSGPCQIHTPNGSPQTRKFNPE